MADSGVETRVMVAPKSSLNQGQVLGFWKLELSSCLNEGHVLHSNVQAKVVSLRHPRTKESASFLHNNDSGDLCELLAFGEEHRLRHHKKRQLKCSN